MEEIVSIEKPTAGGDLELLPCPFCGSEEIEYIKYKHAAGLRWRVFCCGCAAGVDTGWAIERIDVAKIWNKRAPQTKQ